MKRLLELGSKDCRWPIGEPPAGSEGDQFFCAAPRERGRSYCPACCALAYQPSQPERLTERAVQRWAERLAA